MIPHAQNSAAPAVRRKLGISAKSVHTAGRPLRAGETAPAGRKYPHPGRFERYDLLRHAQGLLYDRNAPAAGQHRTCWCQRSIAERDTDAIIYRRKDGTGARLGNVTSCGSGWACPVCTVRISNARREELSAALVAHTAAGGYAYLLTLTAPHERADNLSSWLESFGKALNRWKNSRAYKDLKDRFGRIGSVRSLEITHGENGWHPHVHEIAFADRGLLDDAAALDRLRGEWVRQLQKAGLCPTAKISWAFEHGLDVRGGADAAEYITKYGRDSAWGMSSELTKSHAKIGQRRGGSTPMQLLAWSRRGDGEAGRLYREFVDAFHGKRLITWSPGLKKHFHVNEVEDEEIAAGNEVEDEEEIACTLSVEQLSLVTSRAALGELLHVVAVCDDDWACCVGEFLSGLRDRPPVGQSKVIYRTWNSTPRTYDRAEWGLS